MKKTNKAHAAALAAAVVALVANFLPSDTLSPEALAGAVTLLTWLVVYFVPNGE